jgi:hypothetical protein
VICQFGCIFLVDRVRRWIDSAQDAAHLQENSGTRKVKRDFGGI